MLVFTDKRNELVLFQTAKCDQKAELLINAGVVKTETTWCGRRRSPADSSAAVKWQPQSYLLVLRGKNRLNALLNQ